LEHLPNYPRSEWESVASSLLNRTGNQPETNNTSDLILEAISVLEHPDLKHIFVQDALCEVGVSANIPELGGGRVHGAIDRLIVGPDQVLCVDFKSNTLVPDHPKDVPFGLLRQMAAYTSALAQIYPDKTIQAAILWTKTATLMHLPHDLVMSALSDEAAP